MGLFDTSAAGITWNKISDFFNPPKAMAFEAPYGLKPTPEQQQKIFNYPAMSSALSPVYSNQPSGQVAGATTSPSGGGGEPQPQPPQTFSGTDWNSIYRSQYPGWDETSARADWQAKGSPTSFGGGGAPSGPSAIELANQQARSDIEGGYSGYFSQLDAMLNQGLPAQETAQKGIAESQYTQGVNVLGGQKTEGLLDLQRQRELTETNQAKTLRDLSANLRNSFMAGNVYLGARGAGDSSAANQYAYALTKMGSQQRGDITSQGANIQREIGDREFKLSNIYNTETNNLASERDQKIMQVASWFAEQQNALRQAQAQGQLAKGQDLSTISRTMLDQALAQLNFVTQESSNKKSALEQWAMNNSTTIQQLKTNMQQIGSYNPTQPTSQPIVGQPSGLQGGGFNVPAGYGGYKTEDKDIFGNPIKNYQNMANILGQTNLLQGY